MRRTSLVLVAALTLAATTAAAKVAVMSTQRLVAESEIIVVAKVERIVLDFRLHKELAEFVANDPERKARFSERYAVARVVETWKGSPPAEIEFLASPTWTCDVSRATEGELAVLFLKKDPKINAYVIVNSGYGRAPMKQVGKEWVAEWPWHDGWREGHTLTAIRGEVKWHLKTARGSGER